MTTIEQREIKGLTIKQAWIFVIGMMTIVVSVVGTYYKTMAKLEAMQRDNGISVVQIDTNTKKIDKLDDDLRTLQMRITVLETKITEHENHK